MLHLQSQKQNLLTFFLAIPFLLFFLLFFHRGLAQKHNHKPTSIIFDSDIGPDYDDVGAITILHALEDKGEVKILATIASNKYEGIASVLDVFNTYFHRENIPVGVPKGKAVNIRDSQHWTDSILAKFPHKIKSNAQVPDALEVYRKILASQPDHSVTIVTVGFLTNLANLLNTNGDKFSPMNGRALIEKKVKLLVSMAGKFPKGKEFNLEKDAKSSKSVFEKWPTTIIYSGFEVGEKVKSGLPLIHNNKIHNNPAKDVFKICIPMAQGDAEGRMSWDEITVLVAVKGFQPYYTLHSGKIKVGTDGSNGWDEKGKGQFYLVEKQSPEKVQNIINNLMMQLPRK
jgi:inosine-uridine nucleoside N-ribohydrolase